MRAQNRKSVLIWLTHTLPAFLQGLEQNIKQAMLKVLWQRCWPIPLPQIFNPCDRQLATRWVRQRLEVYFDGCVSDLSKGSVVCAFFAKVKSACRATESHGVNVSLVEICLTTSTTP
jgi:hypothetical protein